MAQLTTSTGKRAKHGTTDADEGDFFNVFWYSYHNYNYELRFDAKPSNLYILYIIVMGKLAIKFLI